MKGLFLSAFLPVLFNAALAQIVFYDNTGDNTTGSATPPLVGSLGSKPRYVMDDINFPTGTVPTGGAVLVNRVRLAFAIPSTDPALAAADKLRVFMFFYKNAPFDIDFGTRLSSTNPEYLGSFYLDIPGPLANNSNYAYNVNLDNLPGGGISIDRDSIFVEQVYLNAATNSTWDKGTPLFEVSQEYYTTPPTAARIGSSSISYWRDAVPTAPDGKYTDATSSAANDRRTLGITNQAGNAASTGSFYLRLWNEPSGVDFEGTVQLGGWIGSASPLPKVQVIVNGGGTQLLNLVQDPFDATRAQFFTKLPPTGDQTVKVKVQGFLSQTKTVTTNGSAVSALFDNNGLGLAGGDSDNNNTIDDFDLFDLTNDFLGSPTAGKYTDINGDGVVDDFDLFILTQNFLSSGN